MNDRLRDKIHDPDPVLARAAALVASVPAIAVSEVRKEYVRRALFSNPPWRVPWLLRPGVAVAILLVASAVVGATIGRSWLVRTYCGLTHAATSARTKERATRVAKPSAQVQPESTSQPTPMPELLPTPTPTPRSSPSASATRPTNGFVNRTTSHDLPAASHANESASVPASEPPAQAAPPTRAAPVQETAFIMAAMRALRREHNPMRAGTLLDDYLHRYPRGVLAEEALALAIEAASARNDPRAAALARTYLQRYPHGRFERAARAAAE